MTRRELAVRMDAYAQEKDPWEYRDWLADIDESPVDVLESELSDEETLGYIIETFETYAEEDEEAVEILEALRDLI